MMSEAGHQRHRACRYRVSKSASTGPPDWLRIAVTDVGGGEPELQSPSSSDPHGRGLQIVKELSDEWGMIDNEDDSGKTVWFAVRLDTTDRPEAAEASTGQGAGAGTGRRRGPPVRRQEKRSADRSGVVKDGRAKPTSQTGGHAPACRRHRIRSGRMWDRAGLANGTGGTGG